MTDDKKPHVFGLNNVRFGKLYNGKFVEDSPNAHPVERMMFGIEDKDDHRFDALHYELGGHTFIDDITPVDWDQLMRLVTVKGQVDEASTKFFKTLASPPLFQLEFMTRRVRLRRTILAHMGKPEHIKKLKSIVRLPRVIIEKRP